MSSVLSKRHPEIVYRDVELGNEKHTEVIMKLCKRNKFYANDIWFFLHQSLQLEITIGMKGFPPITEKIQKGLERSRMARLNWIARGLFAMNGTKVVGFILYSIHRETKQELALNFHLVDHKYRQQNYGSRLLCECEHRHSFNIRYEELGVIYFNQLVSVQKEETEKIKELEYNIITLQTQNMNDYESNAKSEYEISDYITTTVKRDENFDKVVKFYKKNGFADMSDNPTWNQILCGEDDTDFLSLVRVGPKTNASICAQHV
jgi:GNAT superfamily N-acetyltransferase